MNVRGRLSFLPRAAIFGMVVAGAAAHADMAQVGVVTGRVLRVETGEPIIEANVAVRGQASVARTDLDGRYRIELPPGRYELRVYYDIYEPQRIRNVEVRAGRSLTVDVVLRRAGDETISIVVEATPDRSTSQALVAERKKSAAASDAVSAEQIAKSPDSSASDAVRRVVGATVVDGKYVYIRGLGERYSNTLMNGTFLPSSEPDRPAVPLDVFPAILLSNLTLNKTFTPDMPGDFAGGSLNINTREFPEKLFFKVEAKGSFNSATSFGENQTYAGGRDYFGFDDGTRALPGLVPRERGVRLGLGEPPMLRPEVDAVARSFRDVWSVTRARQGVDHGLSATVGSTERIAGRPFGYLATATFSKTYRTTRQDVSNLKADGERLLTRESYRNEEGRESTLLGGLVNVGFEPSARHRLTLVSLFSHSADKSAEVAQGYSETDGVNFRNSRLRFVEQLMSFSMLQGRHRLSAADANLKWQLNYAHTRRDEPDTRDLDYNEVTGLGYRFRNQPGSGERFFSGLRENAVGGALDFTLRTKPVTLKAGAITRFADRTFDARRFRFQFDGPDASVLYQPPELLFAPNTLSGRFLLDERTLATDRYNADVRYAAGYALADVTSLGKLRIVGGVRYEYFRQQLDAGSPFAVSTETLPSNVHADGDFLPALSLIYSLRNDMNLRAAYANTVARPQLRELAPFLFFDFARRRNVQGNPAVQRTYVYNADLRWEFFPGAGQVLAASFFYKHFSQPIERVIYSDNGDLRFDNVASARAFGVELEASTGLGFISERLRELSVGANLTLSSSQVSLAPAQLAVQTSRERPMQGQSPYVVNINIGYSLPSLGAELSLLYNVSGPRILDVGANFLPDVYERPFHRLDVSYAQDLGKHWKLRLIASNLLNQPISLQQGGTTVMKYRPGLNAGATLAFTY